MMLWNPLKYCMSITKNRSKLFPNFTKQQTLPEKVYPKQYPTNISDTQANIIDYQRPIRIVSPKHEVPFMRDLPEHELVKNEIYNRDWKSPENSYSLKVGIVGPTNSGKSLLMNSLTQYVSAVSSKSQTTTEVIQAIKSYEVNTEMGLKNVQLIYYDTPGLFDNKGGVISKGLKVLPEVEFALMVVDCNKRFDTIIQTTVDRLEKSKESFAKALVLNKVDLIDSKRRFKTIISEIEKYAKFDKIFYTSGETGYGLNELTEYLIGMAKPSKWIYPAEARTTLSHRQIYQELMKQALFSRTYEQIPHSVNVDCIAICQKSSGPPLLKFKVEVDSENQQRLILGKQGKNLMSMVNRFKMLCAKLDDEIPQVKINVSTKSKYRRRVQSTEQIILPQDYHIIEAQNDLQTLERKTKTKLSQ